MNKLQRCINLFSEAFTKYKLWLKAFTWKNEGEPSDPFEIVTDVQGPSAPIITNLVSTEVEYFLFEVVRAVDLLRRDTFIHLVSAETEAQNDFFNSFRPAETSTPSSWSGIAPAASTRTLTSTSSTSGERTNGSLKRK